MLFNPKIPFMLYSYFMFDKSNKNKFIFPVFLLYKTFNKLPDKYMLFYSTILINSFN